MNLFRKKPKNRTPDYEICQEIRRLREELETVNNHFDSALDPDLIDCYIYENNAAWKRYDFLIKQVKS